MSFSDLELKVIRWAEQRMIIPNSTPMAQAVKTKEELDELFESFGMSIDVPKKEAMKDAYGDILVTLIIGSALADLDLVTCLNHAYEQIKDRKGYLSENGIWVKQ